MTSPAQPLRLFLDTGVIIEGCFGRWGAAKGVLILATDRRHYTAVLAEAVERELQHNVAVTLAPPLQTEARVAVAEVAGAAGAASGDTGAAPWPRHRSDRDAAELSGLAGNRGAAAAMMFGKPERLRSPTHLAFVRVQPCCVRGCRRTPF